MDAAEKGSPANVCTMMSDFNIQTREDKEDLYSKAKDMEMPVFIFGKAVGKSNSKLYSPYLFTSECIFF